MNQCMQSISLNSVVLNARLGLARLFCAFNIVVVDSRTSTGLMMAEKRPWEQMVELTV